MLKRAKSPLTPQELEDKLRSAQKAHRAAITDAHARLAEESNAVLTTANDRAAAIDEQIQLLTGERDLLADIAFDAGDVADQVPVS